MPIFEYECGSCRKVFEKLVMAPASTAGPAACANCGSSKVVRRFSSFSARSGSGSSRRIEMAPSSGSGGCCSPGSCRCR